MTAVTQYHHNGAGLLTKTIPGWPRMVPLENLDMADPHRCLLFWLCSPPLLRRYDSNGSEWHRWEAMAAYLSGTDDRPHVAPVPWRGRNHWSVKHGFWPAHRGWEPLTEGWLELAAQLRGAS